MAALREAARRPLALTGTRPLSTHCGHWLVC